MTRRTLARTWMLAAAIAATIPAATLTAHAYEDAEAGPIKDIMCAAVQCSKGNTKCADVKGEMKDPTGRGTISVTWYCYEGVIGESEWEM
ncbi:MAG TPA: hypothetical protein VFO55_14260 [Gemmatimonadaceae bacterium]|nr:hypothetical protein [Gemmatimonadaceae bacterium]